MAASISRTVVGIGRGATIDDDSDYGSDFSAGEEQLVDAILAGLATSSKAASNNAQSASTLVPTTKTTTATTATVTTRRAIENGQPHTSISDPHRGSSPIVGGPASSGLGQPPLASNANVSRSLCAGQDVVSRDSVNYPDLSDALSSLESKPPPVQQLPPAVDQTLDTRKPDTRKPDTRTPLQRFRSSPRRPLTVTDLAAGAWCELQHWYTLTRLPGGKRTITPAMRGGSRVHQTLEDEVHSTVRVNITSKEEAFALRLWNIIQGLRTLRDTGITRELEVWGTAHGEIFNGVVDQLTHESPNASFEEELNLASSNTSTQQSSMTDFLEPSHKTVYLVDVKTRGSDRLPTGTALRPARVQLFLYHRLLSDMADDKLDYLAIFERYGLREEARFSDAFMAQIGSLHDEIFYDADSEASQPLSEVYSPDLVAYRSISQIVPLLKDELKETFPRGSASIGNLLAVQYRHRDDGRIIGNNSFPNDPGALDNYIKENLRWWRGEREPEGVSIEDAYKCGWCEFADACEWRRNKEAEFLEEKRMRRAQAGRVSST